MPVHKRNVAYFDTLGFANTSSVIEVVRERLKVGDIDAVVVPATTGKTAELFARDLKDTGNVVTISEDEAISACKLIAYKDKGLLGRLIQKRMESAAEDVQRRQRREALDMTFLPFCGETYTAVSEILYAFGQGMKVAVEVSVAAVEVGKVKPYAKIVAVGGTGEGADTAIVARASPQNQAFGEDPRKRLSIQEIIAMPTEKL